MREKQFFASSNVLIRVGLLTLLINGSALPIGFQAKLCGDYFAILAENI